MTRTHVVRAVVIAALASIPALALTGCSSQLMVTSTELATKAQESLAESIGGEVPPVSCPSDVEAKVGNTATCTITGETGDVYDVTITITAVDEATKDVQLDIQVADEPNG